MKLEILPQVRFVFLSQSDSASSGDAKGWQSEFDEARNPTRSASPSEAPVVNQEDYECGMIASQTQSLVQVGDTLRSKADITRSVFAFQIDSKYAGRIESGWMEISAPQTAGNEPDASVLMLLSGKPSGVNEAEKFAGLSAKIAAGMALASINADEFVGKLHIGIPACALNFAAGGMLCFALVTESDRAAVSYSFPENPEPTTRSRTFSIGIPSLFLSVKEVKHD